MITWKQRFINFTLAGAMALSPGAQANEFMESAIAAAEKNRELAEKFAIALVDYDFEKAYLDIANSIGHAGEIHRDYARFMQARQALQEKLANFANMNLDEIEKTASEVRRLREQYHDLVRERFDLSGVPTQLARRYENLSSILADIIDRFEATCRTGRSDFRYDTAMPPEMPPPPYYFEIMGTFSTDMPAVSYNGLNYRVHHQTRSDIIKASGTAFSVSGSLLLSGAAGSAATMASYICPVAGAAFAVAVAVQHFENMAEANRIAHQYVEAERYKLLNMKRDDYIAEKYREHCESRVASLKELVPVLEKIDASGDVLQAMITEEESRVEEMDALKERLEQANFAKCRLFLSYKTARNECVRQNAGDKERRNTACVISEDNVVELVEDTHPSCRITVDTEGNYENKSADEELVMSVQTEDIRKFVHHKLILTLGKDRRDFIEGVRSTSWDLIDRDKELAFSRFIQFTSLVRKMNQTDLSRKVNAEIAKVNEFEKLRGRFLDLVALSIKVAFHQEPYAAYAQALESFEREFHAFYRRNLLNREVRSLDSTLKQLKGIMYEASKTR